MTDHTAAIQAVLTEELAKYDMYLCTRVLESCSYGTMSADDFEPVSEDSEVIAELAAMLAPVIEAAQREAQADLVDALADEMDATQTAHDIAECAAYTPGETGRQACIEKWENLIEDPAGWMREKATEHRGNDRDHLQEMLYEAWEAGAEEMMTYAGNQHLGIDSPANPYGGTE